MKVKRNGRALVSILMFNFFLLSAAHAYEPAEAEKVHYARVNGQVNAFLAKELGVPLAAIKQARDRDYPFSYAFFFAVVVSQGKGKAKMKDVLDMHDEGVTWGEICIEFGLDLRVLSEEMKRVFRKMIDSGLDVPPQTYKERKKLFEIGPKK